MIKYLITMTIRLICIALCLVVQGWWLLLCAAGAIFLPYVAVVLANAVDSTGSTLERPSPVLSAIASGAGDRTTGEGSNGAAEVPSP